MQIEVSELQVVLNLLAKAPTTVGEAAGLHGTISKLVSLANQTFPIGPLVDADRGPPNVVGSEVEAA